MGWKVEEVAERAEHGEGDVREEVDDVVVETDSLRI